MFLFIFFFNAKILIASTVDKNNYVDNFSPMLNWRTNKTTETVNKQYRVPLHKTFSTTVIGKVPGVFLGVFPRLLPLFFLGWKPVPFLMRHHKALSRFVLVWEIYPTRSAALELCFHELYFKRVVIVILCCV